MTTNQTTPENDEIIQPILPPGAGGNEASPSSPPPSPPRRWGLFLGLLALLLLGGALALLLHLQRHPLLAPPPEAGDPATHAVPAEVVPPPAVTNAPPPAPDPEVLARAARERARAEETMERFATRRAELDDLMAVEWGGTRYGELIAAVKQADDAFVAEDFPRAAEAYEKALLYTDQLMADRPQAFKRMLAAGAQALDEVQPVEARRCYEAASKLDPSSSEAQLGLKRASTIRAVADHLAAGQAHEETGKSALAFAEYEAALALDPLHAPTQTALTALKQRIADEEFRALFSTGLDAYHRKDYPAALRALRKVIDLRPQAPEAREARRMVEEAERLQQIAAAKVEAESKEAAEDYAGALEHYVEALNLDANLAFAQTGKTRCLRLIRLLKEMDHYRRRPTLLEKRPQVENALLLLSDAQKAVVQAGAQFGVTVAAFDTLIKAYSEPQVLRIRSDGKTEITIYRVGKIGAVTSHELKLYPGSYTLVGIRRGYRDVRTTVQLKPGGDGAELELRCEESIR